LGLGDVLNRGDEAGEMQALTPLNLSSTRAIFGIAAGTSHTCGGIWNGTVKCWGLNTFGQLGVGDTVTRGDDPGEMGDVLPDVD
ncbi:MAG TPA: RCC1 domain-containing protein, partial [Vicinamibacteria bacterium]